MRRQIRTCVNGQERVDLPLRLKLGGKFVDIDGLKLADLMLIGFHSVEINYYKGPVERVQINRSR